VGGKDEGKDLVLHLGTRVSDSSTLKRAGSNISLKMCGSLFFAFTSSAGAFQFFHVSLKFFS
jgi:hypothetical protein